jgi:type IV pilus assembly protein PilB
MSTTLSKAIKKDFTTQNDKLESKLKVIEIKEKEIETEQMANSIGVPYINLKGFPISPGAISTIAKEDAERLQIVCFSSIGDQINIGAIEPNNPEIKGLIDAIQELNPIAKINIHLISEHSFELAFYFYKTIPTVKSMPGGVQITEEELNKYQESFGAIKDFDAQIKRASMTEILTLIIAAAIKARVSDIHIEAEEKEIIVRFRIDGILYIVARIPKIVWHKIISRIKLLAGLKINITSKPQDGRFTINLTNDKIEVRVSTLPTNYGESAVFRLLMSGAVGVRFESLGLQGKALHDLTTAIESPNGMIITTGPTGSGKTTTLYAILRKLNDPETKIITLEDPIEYKLSGISQSQVDAAKHYTFADGLRSILRQDPDIVMVGEIRDLETADIAINAALTGHLVLSTIHTNSAAGAIPRFLAMGSKGFLLAPALKTIIGQRLVRKLCPECKKETKIEDPEILAKIENILSTIPKESGQVAPDKSTWKFFTKGGCIKCQDLGYKGRLGIYEIMAMDKDIEQVILSGQVSEYVIQDIAVKKGMITMAQDGLLKVLSGVTSAEEVFEAAG